jgi:predicted transport protein
MDLEEYFETGPEFERPIFEVIREHLQSVDPDVWFEPVSVGIFFKRRSTFVSLRTMTKWIAVSFSLNRKLESGRLSRKVVSHGSRYFHVVNVREAGEIDDQLLEWLAEAWHDDE